MSLTSQKECKAANPESWLHLQVFDDKVTFTDWFGDALSKPSTTEPSADDIAWLEKEKRVVMIHRLHQILEPFMLRRQVEDVESKLPPKVRLREL